LDAGFAITIGAIFARLIAFARELAQPLFPFPHFPPALLVSF
jgi:hypothetical protein